ncbi:MAG: S8 family peptidase [Bdellovibrionales bacterium]|nr:S8 family peptidase [Bdellovibrionales bacterium]
MGSEKRTLLEFHCRGGYRNREEGRKTEKQLKEAFDCFDNLRFEDGHKVSFAEQEVYFFVLSGDEAEKLYDLTDCVFEVESSPAAALRWYYTESSSPDELEIEISPPPTEAPEVVVLDTGCRSEHTLLRSGLVSSHSALVNEESGGDLNGHGTEMCGLAFFGEVLPNALTEKAFTATNWVRSVRVLVQPNQGTATEEHRAEWPLITERAVQIREQENVDNRQAVYSLAVLGDNPIKDSATSWSHMIDILAFNSGEEGRLFCISIGNYNGDFNTEFAEGYPDVNQLSDIADPAQAVNALTVGGYTNFTELPPGNDYSSYQPLAPLGGISPYTSAGPVRSKLSGIKPDVVFEAGNMAVENSLPYVGISTLSHLTTGFTTNISNAVVESWGTSGACALCSNMASRIWALHPELRAETIRGLIVHSASWTKEMNRVYDNNIDDKLRVCGYGVPDFSIASECISSRASVVIEDQMQFERKKRPKSGGYSIERSVKYFNLPLPQEIEDQDEVVELRVTLSYFAEPNGFRRKVVRGMDLAWDIQGPNESAEQFKKRVNMIERQAAKEKGKKYVRSSSFNWEIGPQRRARGTVQSDRWQGPASALAGNKLLAIYPVLGWWERRKDLQLLPQKFSLIISASVPGLDIYTPIKNAVEIGAAVEIEV